VLFFDCPEQEMVKRVLNRNQVGTCTIIILCWVELCANIHLKCDVVLQGRVDDNIETIKKRLEVFDELNWPIVNYYTQRGKLHRVSQTFKG
jgi:UMP-CMP kinase